MRPKLFPYLETREEKEKWFNELFQLLADDKLKLKVHKTYKLEDAQSAHIDIQSRKTTGKLLLEL
jgi:NADPH2:quinone reductase